MDPQHDGRLRHGYPDGDHLGRHSVRRSRIRRRAFPMTLDQIDELRRGEEPSLSLQRAARSVGLDFVQCATCRGNGYTSATLLATPRQIEILAAAGCDDTVPIQYERCTACGGSGGFVSDPRRRQRQ